VSQRTATKTVGKTTSTIDELRTALNQLTAADRRLRGRDHSRPGELTFAQIRTIAALGREHEMTAGQLAKSAELTPAAITAIVDQLEATNIVERRRSTEDRRVCNVALTPEGWELLERKLAVWNGLWAERLSGFSDEDIATAAAILHEVTGILDSVASSLDSSEPQA
jgi:MarR family transcriptional regulator, organic hydroperoxide resistance regulator